MTRCAIVVGSGTFRASAAFVIALLLVMAPQLAEATFTSLGSSSQSVGTFKLVAPATVTTTSNCPPSAKKSGSVNVSDFGAVPRATSYVLTVTSPGGNTYTVTVTSRSAFLSVSDFPGSGAGTWTLTIKAELGPWTGPPLVYTFRC